MLSFLEYFVFFGAGFCTEQLMKWSVEWIFTCLSFKFNFWAKVEIIIKSQRIMCCKKFAENQQSNWKIILSHYMKNVGSKLIWRCAFDLKKFCIHLPKYYEECFRCFAEYSVANKLTEQALCQEIHNTVIWNNKFICVQGKSVFLSLIHIWRCRRS